MKRVIRVLTAFLLTIALGAGCSKKAPPAQNNPTNPTQQNLSLTGNSSAKKTIEKPATLTLSQNKEALPPANTAAAKKEETKLPGLNSANIQALAGNLASNTNPVGMQRYESPSQGGGGENVNVQLGNTVSNQALSVDPSKAQNTIVALPLTANPFIANPPIANPITTNPSLSNPTLSSPTSSTRAVPSFDTAASHQSPVTAFNLPNINVPIKIPEVPLPSAKLVPPSMPLNNLPPIPVRVGVVTPSNESSNEKGKAGDEGKKGRSGGAGSSGSGGSSGGGSTGGAGGGTSSNTGGVPTGSGGGGGGGGTPSGSGGGSGIGAGGTTGGSTTGGQSSGGSPGPVASGASGGGSSGGSSGGSGGGGGFTQLNAGKVALYAQNVGGGIVDSLPPMATLGEERIPYLLSFVDDQRLLDNVVVLPQSFADGSNKFPEASLKEVFRNPQTEKDEYKPLSMGLVSVIYFPQAPFPIAKNGSKLDSIHQNFSYQLSLESSKMQQNGFGPGRVWKIPLALNSIEQNGVNLSLGNVPLKSGWYVISLYDPNIEFVGSLDEEYNKAAALKRARCKRAFEEAIPQEDGAFELTVENLDCIYNVNNIVRAVAFMDAPPPPPPSSPSGSQILFPLSVREFSLERLFPF